MAASEGLVGEGEVVAAGVEGPHESPRGTMRVERGRRRREMEKVIYEIK